MTEQLGEVITFYSYKGGTGRTMALANIACLLAKGQQAVKGKKVLMIDWDLNAPGLHRYFYDQLHTQFPQESYEKGINDHSGLLDIFNKLQNKIQEKLNTSNQKVLNEVQSFEILDNFDFTPYILSTDFPYLDLLKAGSFNKEYQANVNTFQWEKLYSSAPLLFEIFAHKLSENYSYTLIDSRTGNTDISNICTMLMPTKLVVVFTPNYQSLTGIGELIKEATRYRRKSSDVRGLMIFPLPSRIELSENDLRNDWRNGSQSDKKIQGYKPFFEKLLNEIYALPKLRSSTDETDLVDLNDYFNEVQLQHIARYAYGERIAFLEEPHPDRLSIVVSYKKFLDRLKQSTPWNEILSEDDLITENLTQYDKILSQDDLVTEDSTQSDDLITENLTQYDKILSQDDLVTEDSTQSMEKISFITKLKQFTVSQILVFWKVLKQPPLVLQLFLIIFIASSLTMIVTSIFFDWPKPIETLFKLSQDDENNKSVEKLKELDIELIKLRGDWQGLRPPDEVVRQRLARTANPLAEEFLSLPDAELNLGWQIKKYLNALYVFMIAADVECDQKIGLQYSEKALQAGTEALKLITEGEGLLKEGGDYGLRLNAWLREDLTRDRVNYLIALTHAIRARLGVAEGKAQALKSLSQVSDSFFVQEGYPQNNPLLSPFLCDPSDPNCPKLQDTDFCPG